MRSGENIPGCLNLVTWCQIMGKLAFCIYDRWCAKQWLINSAYCSVFKHFKHCGENIWVHCVWRTNCNSLLLHIWQQTPGTLTNFCSHHLSFTTKHSYLHKHRWKNCYKLKNRKISQMPQQRRALCWDRASQPDTLNPTQVQSSASAHVASTWTALRRRKTPKEQKEFTEREPWVINSCVLCLRETDWKPHVCTNFTSMCLCVFAMAV